MNFNKHINELFCLKVVCIPLQNYLFEYHEISLWSIKRYKDPYIKIPIIWWKAYEIK